MTSDSTMDSSCHLLGGSAHPKYAHGGEQADQNLSQNSLIEALRRDAAIAVQEDGQPKSSLHKQFARPPSSGSDLELVALLDAIGSPDATNKPSKATKTLQQYRPADIPQFRDRSSHRPDSRPLSRYQLPPSQWPHYRQFYQNKLNTVTVAQLPPKTAPFHEQFNAFIISWNIWASAIPDDSRRAEVLKWTTLRMEQIWKEAMTNGLWPQVGNGKIAHYILASVHVLHQYLSGVLGGTLPSASQLARTATNTEQAAKQRKKRPEPEDAWLFPDGLPCNRYHKSTARVKQSRVTETEIRAAGIDHRAVEARAYRQDLENCEELFNSTIQKLGRDIDQQDWYGVLEKTTENPLGRDLLMYALHEVQVTQMDIIHLQRLFRGFNKSSQKSNTMARIDEQQYRQGCFRALAIEVHKIRKKEIFDISDDGSDTSESQDEDDRASAKGSATAEPTAKALQVDREDVAEKQTVLQDIPVLTPTAADMAIIDLATEVLAQPHNSDMAQAFESRMINEPDLSKATYLSTQEDTSTSKMGIFLLYLLRNVNKTIALQQTIKKVGSKDKKRDLEAQVMDAGAKIASDTRLLRTELDKLTTRLVPAGEIEAEQLTPEQDLLATNEIEVGALFPGLAASAESAQLMDSVAQDEAIGVMHQAVNASNRNAVPSESIAFENGQMVSTNLGEKREFEEVESGTELPPTKQQKLLDGQPKPMSQRPPPLSVGKPIQPLETPQNDVLAGTERTVSLSISPSARGSRALRIRLAQYCQQVFVPKLNKALRQVGVAEVGPEVSKWSEIRGHLKGVGIGLNVRNQWNRDFKSDYDLFHGPLTNSNFPNAEDVTNAMTSGGICMTRLCEIFQSQIGAQGTDFDALVRSVAWMDPTSGLFFKKAEATSQRLPTSPAFDLPVPGESDGGEIALLTTGQRRKKPDNSPVQSYRTTNHLQHPKPQRIAVPKSSKVVSLRVRPHFDPSDNLWDTSIKEFRGFNFRFTPQSTIEERQDIHENLRAYIKLRAAGRKTEAPGIAHRFGKYEAFCAPSGKAVAHGYWDECNKKHAADSEWFFANEFTMNAEGEVVRNDGRLVGTEREAMAIKEEKSKKAMPRRKRKGRARYAMDEYEDSDGEWIDG